MKSNTNRSFKVLSIIWIVLISFLLILPGFGLLQATSHSLNQAIQIIPLAFYLQLEVFIAFLVGRIFSKKNIKLNTSFKWWLLAAITMFLFIVFGWIKSPKNINLYSLSNIFFPVFTAVSPLFSFLILASVVNPLLTKAIKKFGSKSYIRVLSVLTSIVFLFTAPFATLPNNWQAVVLLISFAWGKVSLSKDPKPRSKFLSGILAIVLFVFNLLLTTLMNEAVTTPQSLLQVNWQMFVNVTSPITILIAYLVCNAFKQSLNFSRTAIAGWIPLVLIGQFAQSPVILFYNNGTNQLGLSKLNIIVISIVLVIISFILVQLVMFLVLKIKGLNSFDQKLSKLSILDFDTLFIQALNGIKAFCQKHKLAIYTILFLWLLTVVSIIVVSDNGNIEKANVLGVILGSKFFVTVLTVLFLYALFAIFNFIFTAYWPAIVLTSLITIIWTIAEKEKLLLRGEPIYPSEIQEIANWQTLLPMVGKGLVIAVIIAVLVIIALTVWLQIKKPLKLGSFKSRLVWLIISILLFITPFFFNNQSSPIYYISRGFGNVITFSNPKGDLQNNGPVLTLLDYLHVEAMQKPDGYNEQSLVKIEKHYKQVAKQINKTRSNKLQNQTIVFNLSESFVDPTDFPGAKLIKNDPLKFLHQLQHDTTYGHMLSAGYGGGTANMEYESLTGFNMGNFNGQIMPYLQVVQKYNAYPNIGNQFKYASAIHPFIGSYYARTSVYKKFKFQKFAYLGSQYKIKYQKKMGHAWYLSDETLYKNGLDQIKAVKGGQFINLISMQNHTPYNNWYGDNNYEKDIKLNMPYANGIGPSNFATYTKGAEYTDKAVEQFINEIDKINKPITFVFYGDHYPTIIDQKQLKVHPIKLHATTYFIYSNKYAREHSAVAKVNKDKYVNTSDFIAMMLQQTNSKVTPYQALLTKVHEELPAITINYDGEKGYELINQEGKKVSPDTLTEKQKKLLKDYQMVQYDMTTDKGSLLEKGFYK